MDLDQTNTNVAGTLISWVPGYVAEYGIDGFRLDASKHMPVDFQHNFCAAAGVFCIGEVAGDDTSYLASPHPINSANCGIDTLPPFKGMTSLTQYSALVSGACNLG